MWSVALNPLLQPSPEVSSLQPAPFKVHAATQVSIQLDYAHTTSRSEQHDGQASQTVQAGATEADAPVPNTVTEGMPIVESDEYQSADQEVAHSLSSTQVSDSTKKQAAVPSQAHQRSPQLYGKSVSYCPALVMFVASLGNADDEEQGVVWLAAPKPDGTGIGHVSALQLADSAESHSEPKAQTQPNTDRHPETQSQSNCTSEQDGDDSDCTGEDEEDQSDASEAMDATELPSVERTQAVSLLPISRQEMQSPGLLLGIPSHGVPGLVAYIFEPAENDGSGCAVVVQVQDMQVIQDSMSFVMPWHTQLLALFSVFS